MTTENLWRDDLERPFQTAIAPATTTAVKTLLAALKRGDVIRGKYHDLSPQGQDRGCLFHWAYGLISRSQREDMFHDQPEVFQATERVIAAWDHYGMAEEFVARQLVKELERREALNASEEATIRAVRARIKRRRAKPTPVSTA